MLIPAQRPTTRDEAGQGKSKAKAKQSETKRNNAHARSHAHEYSRRYPITSPIAASFRKCLLAKVHRLSIETTVAESTMIIIVQRRYQRKQRPHDFPAKTYYLKYDVKSFILSPLDRDLQSLKRFYLLNRSSIFQKFHFYEFKLKQERNTYRDIKFYVLLALEINGRFFSFLVRYFETV